RVVFQRQGEAVGVSRLREQRLRCRRVLGELWLSDTRSHRGDPCAERRGAEAGIGSGHQRLAAGGHADRLTDLRVRERSVRLLEQDVVGTEAGTRVNLDTRARREALELAPGQALREVDRARL